MSALEEINLLFKSQLQSGVLIQRYKRFLADVQLDSGEVITAHCANTGSMRHCAEPGWQVWLSYSDNPKRKLAYSWELVTTDKGHWIGINTHRANLLVEEAILADRIPELSGYATLKRECKFGTENSRVDFVLCDTQGLDCYVEVKSVTLLEGEQGYFPDAVSLRGQKHLRELTAVRKQGKRAVLLFCVQHSGIDSVTVANHIDHLYGAELINALANGVEVMAYSTIISSEKILINQRIPFIS